MNLTFKMVPLRVHQKKALQTTLRVMKLTAFLFIVFGLHVSASGVSQTITFTDRSASLEKVFKIIKQQTGFVVLYNPSLVEKERPVNINARNMSLSLFLLEVLKERSLTYSIIDKTVIVSPPATEKPSAIINRLISELAPVPVTGMVRGTGMRPLAGATIQVKGTRNVVLTGETGLFTINAEPGAVLTVSFIGYESQELSVGTGKQLLIVLKPSMSILDETVVMAYGTTSKRLNTGNITTVKGEELAKAPVSNPLAALQGRVPGMIITQTTGVPGSAFKVQIRGRTQVDKDVSASEEPLYIIDGVPMASGNANINLLPSAISGVGTTGLSPFSTINTADIESIEVLKDADATAIYGSRGASGVILITTTKGKTGNTRFNLTFNTGASKAPLPDLLSTKEYVAMRNEAFRNDNNRAKTTANAYDLLLYDTTRDNNLVKQLIGGTARFTNAQGSVSGGNNLVQYLIGGGYYNETNVYPDKSPNSRGSAHFSITSRSADQKFSMTFTGNYSASVNKAPSGDLAFKMTLPPNYQLYDAQGNIAWNEKGFSSDNPLAYARKIYNAKTDNMLAGMILTYKIIPDLNLKTSVGYNSMQVDETGITPKTALNPNGTNGTTGSSSFGNNKFKSWIVEPQAEYIKKIGKGNLTALAGATLQFQKTNGYNFSVNGYTNDAYLGSLVGISPSNFLNPQSSESQYKYQAFFGRVTYNHSNKYIVNLSGRRDGSSRFGPNYRFSNFGAAGGAWLFSSEEFMKAVPFISFGKLRASYGVTGNDKIGDYKYIDLYSNNLFAPTYRDSTSFYPSDLFKPDLHWERNNKLEVAIELGALNDRILLSAAWYRNRSNDPLVNYPLPSTTGFVSIAANLNGVVVQNKGYELMLNSSNIKSHLFDWTTSFNITFPQNKLLKFPGLATSTYATKAIIGRSLDVTYIADWTGVNPATGLSEVRDINKNGTFQASNSGDFIPLFDIAPNYYGGMQNNIRIGQFDCSIYLQYTKQKSFNWRNILSMAPVGTFINVPDIVSDRWQKPGDITATQKFSTLTSASNSLSGSYSEFYSDLRYSDVSYIRVKTVALTYTLPSSILKKIKMTNAKVFMNAQNLFTITHYRGGDPETHSLSFLPPLRTITAGFQINF